MEELIRLAKLLREASELFSSKSNQELDTSDITWQQVLILEQIVQYPKTIGEISKAVEMPYSTISGLVDRLERENLVKRVRDEHDRRMIWVALTERVSMSCSTNGNRSNSKKRASS
ncbi:UNVERIFIED_CONTAM: DNA-binding MarR family transcriptional regulator [Brevibacillus sp. OAP136]